jgi:hypothetical protein
MKRSNSIEFYVAGTERNYTWIFVDYSNLQNSELQILHLFKYYFLITIYKGNISIFVTLINEFSLKTDIKVIAE